MRAQIVLFTRALHATQFGTADATAVAAAAARFRKLTEKKTFGRSPRANGNVGEIVMEFDPKMSKCSSFPSG